MQGLFLLIKLFLILMLNLGLAKTQQIEDPIIDPNNFDKKRLELLILEKVNQVRESYNIKPLVLEGKLEQAADSQAKNMQTWNRVSHHQISLNKFSLANRVEHFKIKNKHIGENVADIYLEIPMKVNFAKDILLIKTYKESADALVLSWKYSPGHFKNMIDPSFKFTGIKVEINPTQKTIYAAQVFGSED